MYDCHMLLSFSAAAEAAEPTGGRGLPGAEAALAGDSTTRWDWAWALFRNGPARALGSGDLRSGAAGAPAREGPAAATGNGRLVTFAAARSRLVGRIVTERATQVVVIYTSATIRSMKRRRRTSRTRGKRDRPNATRPTGLRRPHPGEPRKLAS